MTGKKFVLIFTGLLAVCFSAACFAQEEQSKQQPAATQQPPVAAPETAAAPESTEAPAAAQPVQTEWLYGEVNSVDIANKAIVLTYLDYDTDIEKQATVFADDKTIFENVKSLEDIKPQDMVSIDYVIGEGSRNIAVTVSVEKLENVEGLNAEPQAPAAGETQMKPEVTAPSGAPQENPANATSDPGPDKP
jgi:hypothetical protein